MSKVTILDEINQKKRIRVEERKKSMSLDVIKNRALQMADKGLKNNMAKDTFHGALAKPGVISIIAEVKKASPSRGIISEEFDYLKIAKQYEDNGASAISVLTEEDYFLGSDEYFREIVGKVTVPLLRKDFIVDEYQVYESFLLGASAILLIMKSLTDIEAANYFAVASKLGMDSLFEAHEEEEVIRAVKLGARIIGVNNRDLRDFTVDIRNSEKLLKHIPKGIISVSESGINTTEDIMYLKNIGVDAVLIGEALMKSSSVKEKLGEFQNEG